MPATNLRRGYVADVPLAKSVRFVFCSDAGSGSYSIELVDAQGETFARGEIDHDTAVQYAAFIAQRDIELNGDASGVAKLDS